MDYSSVKETKINNDTDTVCSVKRSRASYEAEMATYDDLWKEIKIKNRIHVKTSEQMIRYKTYMALLMEYISLYE